MSAQSIMHATMGLVQNAWACSLPSTGSGRTAVWQQHRQQHRRHGRMHRISIRRHECMLQPSADHFLLLILLLLTQQFVPTVPVGKVATCCSASQSRRSLLAGLSLAYVVVGNSCKDRAAAAAVPLPKGATASLLCCATQ